MFDPRFKKPTLPFNPQRRATLKKAGIALGAGMLPLAASLPYAATQAPQAAPSAAHPAAARTARYRRYNASGSRIGLRMLDSYARAVRAMLALPPEDPRNWYRHAIIHTLDCPHGNWWFLSWHRGYLGWFEQICRELSGDPQFALPYWDWTTEPKVPAGLFKDVLDPNHSAFIPTARDFESRLSNALANAGYWTSPGGVYNPRSQYGQLLARRNRFDADLMFDIVTDPSGRMFYDQPNARGVRRERPDFSAATVEAVSPSTIQAALAAPDYPTFASQKSSNHATMGGFGILEGKPHNSVHRCVGSRDCNFVEAQGFMNDMLSSVDPLFYLHHANLDRLWDVWTRKQALLGLPTLPNGVELRTDLPDDQKSPQERATDYYRWARELFLFFVDGRGAAVTKTRNEDYASMAAFDYDYEPGAGEEVVTRAASQGRRAVTRRVFNGTVSSKLARPGQPASASVQVPAAALEQAVSGGAVLVANITLNFPPMAHHQPYVVILNGPDDPSGVDVSSPFYLTTLTMFGHHAHAGAVTYAVPLGEKLGQARAAQAQAQAADGALQLRIVPMHATMGHHGHDMADMEPAELLAVNVETY